MGEIYAPRKEEEMTKTEIPTLREDLKEIGTWKWFGVAFVYQTVLAWGRAFLVYQGGTLLWMGG